MRKIGLIVVYVMISGYLFGQPTFGQRFEQVVGVLPSAPNASAIAKYGGININLNKGMMSHAYPLYELKLKDVSIPFSLNYTANGLKVDECASRVGFNWVLEAGGVISRTVYGHPDEGSQRLEMPAGGPQVSEAYMDFLTKATGGATYDPQPDVFNYSFNGVSGRFVLDKNKVPVVLDGSPIKIETDFNSTDWNFKITNVDGNQFFFGGSAAKEETRTENTCGKPYTTYVPTSWYLKKIITVHGQEVVFNYTSVEFQFFTGNSTTLYYDQTPNFFCPDTANGSTDPGPPPVYCVSYTSQSTTCAGLIRSKGKYLTSVTATGVGSIEFQTTDTRQDCGDVLYTGMTIKEPSGQAITQYQLSYTTLNDHRPFLTKISRSGNVPGPLEETGFIYNPGQLPGLNAFSQDHFGYYNGSGNSTLLPLPELFSIQDRFPGATADREPNPVYAAMGMLSKIVYPTGGSDTIIYEGNDFNEYKQILPPRATLSVSATGPGFKQTTTVESSTFTVDYNQEARVEITIENLIGGAFDPIHDRGTAIVKTTSGDEVFYRNDNPGYYIKTIVTLGPGSYKLEARGTGNGIKTLMTVICRPGATSWGYVNTPSAGVRVKKVITSQPGIAVQQVKTYNYRQVADASKSSGGVQPPPEYMYYFNNRQFCNGGVVTYLYCNYIGMYSSSTVPVLLYEGGVSYENVTESWGENAENGMIQHFYHVGTQTPASQAGMGSGFLTGAPMTNTGTLNGKEKQTLIYRRRGANLELLKKMEYSHKVDSRGSQIIEATAVNKKYNNEIVNSFLSSVDFEGYDVARYSCLANWTYVDTVKETQYTESGLPSVYTTTIYQYDNATHRQLSKTVTQQSDGRTTEGIIRYPLDFSSITATDATSASIKGLQTRGVMNVPLEQMSYVANADGSNRKLATARFALFDNSGLNLKEVWQTELASPLGDFAPASVVSGAVNTDNRYKKQVFFDAYDSKGNILQQSRFNNVKLSYIWGYASTNPVAQVVNAKQNEIFFDSFEELDGWDSGLTAYDNSKTHTGRYAGRIDGQGVAHALQWTYVSLSGITKFKYSGWIYSDGPDAEIYLIMRRAGETNYYTYYDVISTSVTGKWVYLEKIIDIPQDVEKILLRVDNESGGASGKVWVDDLRLHPAAAQMTTYTYDRLVGVTSQSDINSRPTYHEYDGLGRLALVRDQDRNILKKICYNYKGQPDACSFDGTPNWQNTSAPLRCKTVNGINTGEREQEQQDMNQHSATGGSLRWVVVDQNCSVCPKPAIWQPTGNYRCVTSGGNNTGEQEREEINTEACSATPNQTRWVSNGTNTTACPTCNVSTCIGDNKKCVNSVCETGIKVYTFCEQVTQSQMRRTYHYEFSNGSWSSNFTELVSGVCPIE